MGVRIDALDATAVPSRLHEVPAMKDGLTVKLTVGQILDLIIDSAPGALDTLNELAAALGDDADFATTVTNALALKANLASPAFTGNPTAPTPSPEDNDTSIATTAFVTAAVATVSTNFSLASSVATTSGTSVDFTGIPSTAKRVTLNLYGISTNGTSDLLVQGGTSGGVENSGYVGDVARFGTSSLATAQATAGLNLTGGDVGAADLYYGKVVFEKVSGNLWIIESKIARGNSTGMASSMAGKTFAAALDRVRLTTAGGANTFDAGTASISWEI